VRTISDPDDEDEIDGEPDNPDEWRDCSEDHDDCLNETLDAEGVPRI
jgi:hypothetical protein